MADQIFTTSASAKAMADTPKGWKMTTLGKVAEIITGKTPPTSRIELFGKTYPFITPTDIKSDSIFYNRERGLSKEGARYQKNLLLPKNTICYTCIASIGKICITKKESFTNQQINSLIVNNQNDWRYIYYSLKYNTPQILRTAGGTTTGIINKTQFSNFEIVIAPLPEQRVIAAVLGSLDDKIELLREQNKTLEATSQAVFKEWFAVPSDLSAKALASVGALAKGGELPKGWRIGKLTEMFDFMEGPGIRNWQYTESGRRFINIRLIQNGDIDIKNSNFISVEEAEGVYKHFHLQEKDMVVSTSGTLGRSAVVRKEHLPLLLNTSVIRFRPIDKQSYAFMYQFLNSPFFQNELESLASGSVQLNFGPVHLKQIEMIIPNEKILKAYAMSMNPLYEKTANNFSQIQTLSTLRDTLLPKLMKGEMRVKSFNDLKQ